MKEARGQNKLFQNASLLMCCCSFAIGHFLILKNKSIRQAITPASNLGYLAPPPGQFFMGAKLFIGTPWMGNEGVLKKILVWAM